MARNKPTLPVLEFDKAGLPTVSVEIDDEEDIEPIIDEVRRARGDPFNDELAEFELILTETRDRTVSARFMEVLYEDQVEDLETILTVFATRQAFYNDIVYRDDPIERKVMSVGTAAARLIKRIENLKDKGWDWALPIKPGDRADLEKLLHRLAELEKAKIGALKKDTPDLLTDLLGDLAQWWRDVVGKEPTFWVSKKIWLDAPFMRFLDAVISTLPAEVRPSKSQGSGGVQRNAAKKRHEKAKHLDQKWEDTIRRFANIDEVKKAELEAVWDRAMKTGAQRKSERDRVRLQEALQYLSDLETYATTQRAIVQEYLTKLEAEASDEDPI